jgi:two-component system, NarL family, sensor kinase
LDKIKIKTCILLMYRCLLFIKYNIFDEHFIALFLFVLVLLKKLAKGRSIYSMDKYISLLFSIFIVVSFSGTASPYHNVRQESQYLLSLDFQRANSLSAYFINRAEYYVQLNQLDSSNAILLKVLELADESGIDEKKAKAMRMLAENFRKQGDKVNSLFYYDEYLRLKDILIDQEKEEIAGKLSYRIESLENELQDAAIYQDILKGAKNELENTRVWLFYTWFIALLVVVAGIIYHIIKLRILSDRISVAEEKFNQQNRSLRMIIDEDEKERINIATELYNGLGKVLSQTKMQMFLIEDIIGKGNKQIAEDTLELIDLAESKTHSLSRYLVPGELVQEGLIPAVNELIRSLKHTKTLEVIFRFEDYAIQPPIETEVTLYRIIKEILNYAIKHPDVSQIIIYLKSNGTQISIDVSDNGKGFKVSDFEKENETGWLNLNTRVHILNGALSINSSEKEGTRIKVDLLS